MKPEVIDDPSLKPSFDELPADTTCLNPADLVRYTRKGYTIDCPHTQRWGQGYQIVTPCCEAQHRNIRSGELMKCRVCGWWYRVFYDETTTRWVSSGHGSNSRRKR